MAEPTPPPPPALLDGAALFLDFDGTLVELAESPAAISVAPDVRPLLRRLDRRLAGRLAIVTGRAIADLEAHLDCAGIAVSGSHGLELRLRDGTAIQLAAPTRLSDARPLTAGFVAARDGLLLEDKPFSIAVHYRKAPQLAGEAEAFLSDLANRLGMAVQHGKMVVELRPHGADKGDAVRAFMAEPPFAGARPVFMGDDLTDETAFAAAAAMGGGGILVGSARPTAARWRLAGVAEAVAWLDRAAGAADG
ncbi:MAG TPA: trehalose-phosphatase [Allosphingosinicella sp.]|nr:trehalose-phosphatase [Allosphingosinicella sp.]